MPTDDILWKKLDSLVVQQEETPEIAAPALQQSPGKVPASPASPRPSAGKRASKQASTHASEQTSQSTSTTQGSPAGGPARPAPCYPSEWIELTRKTIKLTGKETTFTRLTAREKERLSDVVYGLRRQGIKTSENEVLRIAINHLLEDFQASGDASFLRRVVAALLA
jgi:hypothetical protein